MWLSERVIAVPSSWQKLHWLLMLLIHRPCSVSAGGMPLPLGPVPGNSLFAGGWSNDSQ